MQLYSRMKTRSRSYQIINYNKPIATKSKMLLIILGLANPQISSLNSLKVIN